MLHGDRHYLLSFKEHNSFIWLWGATIIKKEPYFFYRVPLTVLFVSSDTSGLGFSVRIA